MTISRLTLHNFRNYPELRIQSDNQFVVLSGENGAGKTNILEAVSLLAPGRGLRRAALRDIARERGTGEFAVAAELDDVQLGTGTTVEQPDRRKTRINGTQVPTNELADRLSILWLTPAMDRLFMEGASGRRNFLDRLVTALNPSHARNSNRYDAARRERNRLLSEDIPPDPRWLDGLDQQLAEFGSAIANARNRLVKTLNKRLQESQNAFFATPMILLEDDDLLSEAAIFRALQSNRNADQRAGRTQHGPHRSDMRVIHQTKNQAAEKCSTGEQKALLFSIVLGHADCIADERPSRPILLLDEVAAHLDPKRRGVLFEKLAEKGSQVWLTGTEPALFDDIPNNALHFEVADGNLSER
ncbi:MAG: DNA replication/repair protein RecF [Parasphingorhabdus sp.]